MRKLMIIGLFAIVSLVCKAQEHIPTIDDYKRFIKSKTMVVLEDAIMSEYNIVIKDIMARSWDITPYEVISFKQFEELKDDPDLSFLMTTVVTFAKDKTKARYNFLSLVMGEPKANVKTMPDLCSLPLSYLKVDEESYNYKLEAFILFIQNHVRNVLQNEKLIGENALKLYNAQAKGALANKTLLLVKEDLAKELRTEAAIKAVYPYKFKIVEREEIAEAIERQDPDVVFLHKVGPEGTRVKARVYKILVGAADSKLYYWNYEMMDHASDDAFQAKDFKKLK